YLNKVFLMGNLTRDPDTRSLPSGTTVCEFGLAMNRRFSSNGKEQEESCFVEIVVWGRSAENCRQYLEKGSQVLVEGRLRYDQWEDRNGGGKRSKLSVVADQVTFIGARRDNPQGGNSYGNNNYNAPQQNPYGDAPRQNPYGAAPQQNPYGAPQMPRQQVPQYQGSMPRQQPPMPSMDAPEMPQSAFNPDEGMEDDIPF
ncbi:MAG: single-stranded DNA-binding protein, partial [Lentisphaeria bacterium]|nr:single-stranded DNA-binding protein [Lentisphaeria bacterium]